MGTVSEKEAVPIVFRAIISFMALLKVKNLHILNLPPLNIEVNAGECLAITGDSGCGKSLFLRALADLDPNQGEIFLEDTPLSAYDPWEWRTKVGLLPADSSWWLATVKDHFPGEGVSFYQKLAAIGLPADIFDSPTHLLSSGERQRLSLLRLLRNKPTVLLLDEPTANLDPNNSSLVERLLTKYLQIKNGALIWVTHDINQANRVASRHLHFSNQSIREITSHEGESV